MPLLWPDRLKVLWALQGWPGSRQVPYSSWGDRPQFSGLCWAHLASQGAAWAPDPTWHYAGSLWTCRGLSSA